MLAGLPYVVWPIGSLFILASRKKDDPYLLYHAVQGGLAGLALGIAALVAFALLVLVFQIMPAGSADVASSPTEAATFARWSVGALFPGFLGMALFAGGTLICLATFLTAVFLGWRATEGELLRIPFLGDIAEEKMVDHSGLTRREFNQMLEAAFRYDEMVVEEEIPFPEQGQQSAQVPQSRQQTRAEQLREARQTKEARERETRHLGGAPPPAPAQQNYRQGGVVDRALNDSGSGVAKSYPLISSKPKIKPSPPQRSPEPPRQATSAPGWQQQSAASWTPAPASQSPPGAQSHAHQGQASPKVRDVDLVRHYQQRRTGNLGSQGASSQGGQQSDVLRQWLSKVDKD